MGGPTFGPDIRTVMGRGKPYGSLPLAAAPYLGAQYGARAAGRKP